MDNAMSYCWSPIWQASIVPLAFASFQVRLILLCKNWLGCLSLTAHECEGSGTYWTHETNKTQTSNIFAYWLTAVAVFSSCCSALLLFWHVQPICMGLTSCPMDENKDWMGLWLRIFGGSRKLLPEKFWDLWFFYRRILHSQLLIWIAKFINSSVVSSSSQVAIWSFKSSVRESTKHL